jgi:hypothetical protein
MKRLPKEPAALRRQSKKLEIRKAFADLSTAQREHRLREQRANLLGEMQRLQSTANEITPGLREYLASRAAQVRLVNRALNR